MRLTLLLIFLLMLIVPVNGQQETRPSSSLKEIPRDVYFAMKIKSANDTVALPSLAYWGHKNDIWTAAQDRYITHRFPDVAFLGDRAVKTLAFDPYSKQLTGVSWSYASTIKDRRERFIRFTRIKNQLLDAYGDPTNIYHEPQTVNGTDSYVAGLVSSYQMKWEGPETVVSIMLSDADLLLQFNQAPYSRASELLRLTTKN